MKAIVCATYGAPEVLELAELPRPVPGDGEVLVEIRAASVNFNNLAFVNGKPFLARFWTGLVRPKFKIPGNDIAGRVAAVGRNVSEFKPGDEVFGDIGDCGYGAFAEYAAVPENVLALKPANASFEEAAAVPQAALVALQALRDKGRIAAGQKVLVYGASGGIGSFAVQIAKAFGAEATGVCSTRNLDLVRSLGADHVIDYTQQDFAQNGQRYDLILATAGYRSIFDYRRALSPKGIYVATGGSMKGPKASAQIFEALLIGPLLSLAGTKKLGSWHLKTNRRDLIVIKDLIEAGKVKPIIDRCYALSEVPEALRYYGEGRSRGKVVVTMGHNGDSLP